MSGCVVTTNINHHILRNSNLVLFCVNSKNCEIIHNHNDIVRKYVAAQAAQLVSIEQLIILVGTFAEYTKLLDLISSIYRFPEDYII